MTVKVVSNTFGLSCQMLLIKLVIDFMAVMPCWMQHLSL